MHFCSLGSQQENSRDRWPTLKWTFELKDTSCSYVNMTKHNCTSNRCAPTSCVALLSCLKHAPTLTNLRGGEVGSGGLKSVFGITSSSHIIKPRRRRTSEGTKNL